VSEPPVALPPPFRVETERLVLRGALVSDAPRLKEALDESREHLVPWLPWAADDPQPVEEKRKLLAGFHARFRAGEDFFFGIHDRDETRFLGGTGLHPRVGPRAFEIGYWIRVGETGKGLATEAAAALTRVAFEICRVDRVEIRVEPANAPSLVIPRKLGFEREAVLKRRVTSADGSMRDVVVHSLFASTYPGSPPSRCAVRCFDEKGRPVPIAPAGEGPSSV
jgi:RimJ/RimL family protein N-acetyltransferase